MQARSIRNKIMSIAAFLAVCGVLYLIALVIYIIYRRTMKWTFFSARNVNTDSGGDEWVGEGNMVLWWLAVGVASLTTLALLIVFFHQ
jgi:hypothetical protein